MQSTRISTGPFENEEVEPVQPFQMSIYQNNVHTKDLSRLHFEDEPRVQPSSEGPTAPHTFFL